MSRTPIIPPNAKLLRHHATRYRLRGLSTTLRSEPHFTPFETIWPTEFMSRCTTAVLPASVTCADMSTGCAAASTFTNRTMWTGYFVMRSSTAENNDRLSTRRYSVVHRECSRPQGSLCRRPERRDAASPLQMRRPHSWSERTTQRLTSFVAPHGGSILHAYEVMRSKNLAFT